MLCSALVDPSFQVQEGSCLAIDRWISCCDADQAIRVATRAGRYGGASDHVKELLAPIDPQVSWVFEWIVLKRLRLCCQEGVTALNITWRDFGRLWRVAGITATGEHHRASNRASSHHETRMEAISLQTWPF